MSVVLACLAAWAAVNAAAVALGVRLHSLRPREEPPSLEIRRARPDGEGYASVLTTRLVVHARRVLGLDQAMLLVRERRRPDRLIVVATHGTDEDLIGSAVPIRGVLERIVGDRPLRHGPLDEVVPGAGDAIAITAAAAAASGEVAVLCAASSDREREFSREQFELLDELAAACAAAISDLALGTALEPAMRLVVDEAAPTPELSLASTVGTALGLDAVALAELDMAARVRPRRRFTRLAPSDAAGRLVDAPGLEAVDIVVRCLAERWDGAGRPHGLRGEQIPLASRILSACLALKEMSAGGTSREAALRRLRADRGSRFDPVVVDTIASVMRSSAAPLEARDWAREDAQFETALLAA